ncbi:hypothetical protein C4587_00500, partial [Candidatus Parcubacteria bacterium]
SQLTANITVSGSATTGARNITVTNSDSQQGSCTSCFTVNARPTVSNTSPNNGDQGSSNLSVTVNGQDFVSGAAVSVSGGDVTVSSTNVLSPTQIQLTVNIKESVAAGPGTRDITVTNPDGGTGTLTSGFTVNYNANLVGYWKFDEGSGGTTSDSSGNGNTGNLVNSPAWLTSGCQQGNCLQFNGSNNYVSIPHSTSIDVDAAPLTVSLWLYPTATTNKVYFQKQSQIVGFQNLGASEGIEFRDNATGAGLTASSSLMTLNQWNHLVFVIVNGTTRALYANGSPASYNAIGTWSPNTSATNPLTIPGTGSYFGIIDAVRMYKAVLTATQAQEIYQAGN